jgi:hypothetical protein
MQIANFQERCQTLFELLDKSALDMSQIKTLDVARALEKNVCQIDSITLNYKSYY